jgi:hypothetical protein
MPESRVVGLMGTVRNARVVDGMGVGKYVDLGTWVGALWSRLPVSWLWSQPAAANEPRWAWWKP